MILNTNQNNGNEKNYNKKQHKFTTIQGLDENNLEIPQNRVYFLCFLSNQLYVIKKKMRKLIGQYIRRNSGFRIYFTEDAKFTEDEEFERGERERTRRNEWLTLY